MKFLTAFLTILLSAGVYHGSTFRVLPYLQNPRFDGMTIRWLSESDDPGILTVVTPSGEETWKSAPVPANALAYNPFKGEPEARHPGLPWLHSIHIDQLQPATDYNYRVPQGAEVHSATFRTAPTADQPFRLIVYSDPETEPEEPVYVRAVSSHNVWLRTSQRSVW